MKTPRERAEEINRALDLAGKYYGRSGAIQNADARGEIASRLAWAIGPEDFVHVDVQLSVEAATEGGEISVSAFTASTMVNIAGWDFREGHPVVRVVPRSALSQLSIVSANNLFDGGGPWGAPEDQLTIELLYRDLGWIRLGGNHASPRNISALEELHPLLLEDLTR